MISFTEETRLNSIKNVMDKLNMTLSQAMEILDIPSEEYNKYAVVV